MIFRIRPNLRQIEPLDWIGAIDHDQLAHMLERWGGSPIDLYVIDDQAIGLDETGKRIRAPLVLAIRSQPGVPETDPDCFRIGTKIFSGIALVACRLRGADRFYRFPSAPTGLLRSTLTQSEVQAFVDWRRTPEELKRDARYDEPTLRAYCKRLAQAAEDVCDNQGPGGVLRLYSTDLDGAVSGTINVLPGDWKTIRRYALDAFDRHETAMHEWCLRDVAPYGSSAETRPIKSLATVSDDQLGGGFALRTGDEQVFVRAELAAWSHGVTPRRLPFPGLPLFRQLSDPRGDVIVRIEDRAS